MSPDEYQELGRRYYKLKQYEEAAKAFTEGIDIAPTVSLYDHRAAAYDRLEDYNAAVKDGREMIKLDKEDVKGYLRTASVLEKMEKAETALAIYKYGMKNVPVGDKNFKLLQQLHDKMTRKLSPPKSVDPLTVLPVELAEQVLEYLAFKHVVNCMRVSKGWRDYIAKLPRLWLHLDLSGARKSVPRSFVDKAVRRSQYRLNRITVHRFEHVDVLKNIGKACKDLEELDFLSLPHKMASTLIEIVKWAPKLEKFAVRQEITLDAATQILNARPTLKHLAFNQVRSSNYNSEWKGPFPNLETLSIHQSRQDGTYPMDLLRQTVNLNSLRLSNIQIVSNGSSAISSLPLTTLVLKRVRFTFFPLLPHTLQRLVIESDGYLEAGGSDWVRSRLPELTHLTLADIKIITASSLEGLLDMCIDENNRAAPLGSVTPLQSFCIKGVLDSRSLGLFHPPDNGVFTYSKRILTPALQYLDISTLPCNDDEIDHLVTYETGLTGIDLSYTNITGSSIRMLVDKVPTLKTINADCCLGIKGRSAIEYAGQKGVAVSCRLLSGN
ncbi:hypothetical protein GQ44DRAFT_702407 [Phaeosphaeriaceae sp. PMI808]|nr:hypothetical protein GQ44DRAFT_702407 [Phaeosphaeriaceae sp. PMI808]